MSENDYEFDSSEVPSADPFEIYPDNTVVVGVLEKSEWKNGSKEGSRYVAATFLVVEGKGEGRRFFENFNLENKNEKAVSIAKRKLSALCHATGKLTMKSFSDLEGIPVYLKLGVQQAEGDWPAKNTIKDFSSATPAAPTEEKKNGGKAAAPWGR